MSGNEDATLNHGTLASLREVADGDQSFLDEIFEMYAAQTVANLETMRAALTAGDSQLFGRTAHLIAGASLNVGATRVASSCRAVEAAMTDENARPTAAEVSSIEAEVRTALVAIEAFRQLGGSGFRGAKKSAPCPSGSSW